MRVIMDSDCLIKLTKAGAKEVVADAMEIHVPPLVKRETVDEGLAQGFDDAVLIQMNIKRGGVKVVAAPSRKGLPQSITTRGEAEVASAFSAGSYAAVASDDRRFLRKLGGSAIPYLTAATCLVYAHKAKRLDRAGALTLLDALRPFISSEEYFVTRLYLEGGT